ncbi:hypothetical protein GCM10010973_30080 [Cribrihabitans marinus]|nr:hypothetical protein GCM10010973_30080 [Cribrihabitans marinus]
MTEKQAKNRANLLIENQPVRRLVATRAGLDRTRAALASRIASTPPGGVLPGGSRGVSPTPYSFLADPEVGQ